MAERDRKSAFESEYAYHRREWAIQRVGWVAIALVLLAALAGFFGKGPLSRASVHADSYSVEYERFARYGARTTLTLNTSPSKSASDELSVRISHTLIDAHLIETITPEPKRMRDSGEDVAFVFDAGSAASIIFRLEPEQIGRHAGTIRIGSESLQVSQFVYP